VLDITEAEAMRLIAGSTPTIAPTIAESAPATSPSSPRHLPAASAG
jgi:hypothetical protein